MEIGEVIRKYRKEKDMTQEEMARHLGVTAPAVNKWEKGKGQPDISLLVPLARLLGITLETLLSFNMDLEEEEIAAIVKEIDQKFQTESYNNVFIYTESIINKYPGCLKLIWQLALILDSRCQVSKAYGKETIDKNIYEGKILNWYKRTMESDDTNIQKEAAGSLFAYYLRKENYNEAEKYLKYFPENSTRRKRMEARIYERTNRIKEAYKTYEEILFSEYNILNQVFSSLCMLSIKENNKGQAEKWTNKLSSLAALFDMGDYNQESCKLDLAVYKKDIKETLSIAKAMLNSFRQMACYNKSFMYSYMEFKQVDPSFYDKVKEILLNNFRDKDTFGYMEGNVEWENLIKI